MTLDEAIAHCEGKVCESACGQEHKQLAEWLKELRDRRRFAEVAHRMALEDERVPVEEVLMVGRSFQYSDGHYRGATYDTAKLLCDTIEQLVAGN